MHSYYTKCPIYSNVQTKWSFPGIWGSFLNNMHNLANIGHVTMTLSAGWTQKDILCLQCAFCLTIAHTVSFLTFSYKAQLLHKVSNLQQCTEKVVIPWHFRVIFQLCAQSCQYRSCDYDPKYRMDTEGHFRHHVCNYGTHCVICDIFISCTATKQSVQSTAIYRKSGRSLAFEGHSWTTCTILPI
jgi:hypothetical protein